MPNFDPTDGSLNSGPNSELNDASVHAHLDRLFTTAPDFRLADYPVLSLTAQQQSDLLQAQPERYLDALPSCMQNMLVASYHVCRTAGALDDFDPVIRRVIAARGGKLR